VERQELVVEREVGDDARGDLREASAGGQAVRMGDDSAL
jgi:hypothetical protein